MDGKIPNKIYIPYLMINGIESAIGTGQYPGACVYFEHKNQAEKYLDKIKKENLNVKECESCILEFNVND